MIPTLAKRGSAGALLATAAALLAAGCGDDDATSAESGPYVVATTPIWADVVRAVACDGEFDVRTLLPPGADAHSGEPSLRDREELDGAALVVANGLDLEEALDDTLSAVADGGVPVLRIAEHVEPLAADPTDPHVWFDPTRVRAAVPVLGDALVAAGGDRERIAACVATAEGELADLDAEVEATLAAVPAERRVLVTNHDSVGYFAERYGFTVLGSILPSTSTLTEASPGELEALGEAIEAEGVPAIFAETSSSADDAESLAGRLGVDVVELYTESLGPPGSGVESYADFMRYDAEAVAGALGS
jgi:zinc/manganese transport system substrate-binding protein